jgi:hypothetical protein
MINFFFNILYYFVNFGVGIFFLILGILSIIMPWSPTIRSNLIKFILENSMAISLFGFGFFVIGFTLLINLYMNSKRHYYYVRVGHKSISIDQEVVQQYLDAYWKQLYPHNDIPTRLLMKKNRIKVTAELPHMPLGEQKLFVEKIQDDLQDIFSRTLGYPHDFMLALSFQPKPKHL